MEKFNLENQYQLYLQRVGLNEDKMPEIQRTEMRRLFMGACGQMIILLRDDLGSLPEDEGVKALQDMLDQVGKFFLNETNKLN